MAVKNLSGMHHDRYKWIALTNTTLGVFMATVNSSIILISLPAIFRGVGINPLSPGNVGYLLWLLQGYLLVTAVLVISLGRLGDIVGRVRIYNLGFAVFSFASVVLALDPYHGGSGALWLVLWRLVQGVGGAMLFANSSAILVDAFPPDQRGLAMGINQVAAIGGSFIGLIAGGLLSIGDWRLVFWVSVPFGVLGTVWGYHSLRDNGQRADARIDWWGNLTFAVGLTSLLVAIVYGIQPYGTHSMGWTAPKVLAAFAVGIAFLAAFFVIEIRTESPMFNLRLFKIRAFATGSAAGLLGAISRGGLQFMLIIWLQGIWLPLHGYAYSATPLWAGIYLVPLTLGFLIAGPVSGYLSDRHGARILSTSGMIIFGASFLGLLLVPTDFSYWIFAVMVLLNGVGGGMFSAPNSTAIMNSVPPDQRGQSGRHPGGVHEHRVRALDRHLLLAHDRGTYELASGGDVQGTQHQRRQCDGGALGRQPTRGREPVLLVPRHQSTCEPARFAVSSARHPCAMADLDRQALLPEPYPGPLSSRSRDRLHYRHHPFGDRGSRFGLARQALHPRGPLDTRARGRSDHDRRRGARRDCPRK